MLAVGVCVFAALLAYSNAQSGVTISTLTDYTTAIGDLPTAGNLTYNTAVSPSPIATTFTYTVSGETSPITGTLSFSRPGNASMSPTETVLSGSARPTTLNGTATGTATTSSSPRPTNTTPCNGYPELCERKYSNVTHVAAHNSPFSVQNNIASNQALDVSTQLNDGIRMLQFQVHKPNDTLYLCHTSCDLLNAGTLVAYLTTVREWLDQNRYDVITILMGNSPVLDPSEFVQPVADSGLLQYAYVPSTVPMALDGWPTLGEMILTNKRVVFMLDYEANQAEVPWLLDEFSYMWETPFSPTDRAFPCTVDRPPEQEREVSEMRMSMANHNLNIAISALGLNILVPAYNLLNETNAETGFGSAGAVVDNCTADWNRPPTFLLVDYYNIGSPMAGSVMAVAAKANGVTYNTDSCCGTVSVNAGARPGQSALWTIVISAGVAMFMTL